MKAADASRPTKKASMKIRREVLVWVAPSILVCLPLIFGKNGLQFHVDKVAD